MSHVRIFGIFLHLLAALLVISFVGEREALAQEVVSFPSLDDAPPVRGPTLLHGVLLKPTGPGPFPAVVGLHGCAGLFDKQGKLGARQAAWGELLTMRGYVVLFPDSFGSRGAAHSCAEGARWAASPWAERSYDTYGALRYLQSLPFVIGERIGVMGWSNGGGTVAFAIASNSKARPTDLPKGDFRAAVAFYPEQCSAKSLGDNWTTSIPFLLEIGASDDLTFAPPCVAVIQSAIDHGAPAQMKVYEGAFHDFDWPGDEMHSLVPGGSSHAGVNPDARADALMRVPAFLDAYLKP